MTEAARVTYSAGCNRCLKALPDDPALSHRLNIIRGWLWWPAHRFLNCVAVEHPEDCATCAAYECIPMCSCGHSDLDHEDGPCEECPCASYVGESIEGMKP